MSTPDGPLGRPRGIGFAIILWIFTFGIYAIYWFYVTYDELRGYRKQGVHPIVGVLLAFIAVSYFLVPSYVGRLYKEDGQEPPMTGWGGLWVLIPYVGAIIWIAKAQGALNRFWEAKASAGAGAAAPPAGLEPPAGTPAEGTG